MDEADHELGFDVAHAFPSLVSFLPFSPAPTPSSRRLSGNFTKPSRPVLAARQLAWVSLQGRLENADEASSARAIGGGLSPEQAVAWELFSPIHRFLVVAVIGVAVAESKKNRQIWRLKNAVELRDQVLLSMQQKLDDLCEQVNQVKDQSGTEDSSFNKNVHLTCNEGFAADKIKFVDCGCWLCDQHRDLFSGSTFVHHGNAAKSSIGDEMLQYKLSLTNEAEQEERRMSDLSDWASSVTSATEIQMNTLAIEQDIYNLKKDCEDKDATIKELTSLLHSSDVTGSRRIEELEEIIRRKNMIVSKLKKDMAVLEQKVVQLTRAQRSSSSPSDSNTQQFPYMTENLLYDMDSSTSPSSSDSDSSPSDRPEVPTSRNQQIIIQNIGFTLTRNQKPAKPSSSLVRPTDLRPKSQLGTPLKEISINRKLETVSSLTQRESSAGSVSRINQRRSQAGSKNTTPRKRFV